VPTITLKVMQTVRHIRATRRIARNSPANMDTASSAVALGTICRRNHAVGRLDGTTSSLPDLKLFRDGLRAIALLKLSTRSIIQSSPRPLVSSATASNFGYITAVAANSQPRQIQLGARIGL
jgi:hypothetical protein